MDLITLENTSEYAIEALYRYLWECIPNKYRIPENDNNKIDLNPFYDPLLTVENRFQYKVTNVEYESRKEPWFVITWNPQGGLLDSSLTLRRLDSDVVETSTGKYKYKFMNAELQVNFGIISNTLTGLFELQEYLYMHIRMKQVCYSRNHPIIGSFPVGFTTLSSNQQKLDRNKGTLCYLFLNCKIDYPVIGFIEKITNDKGIIKEIHLEVDKELDNYEKKMLATNIIKDDDDTTD